MTVRRCAKVLTGGIAGQRQVSAPASNVGLHVGATVGEADFPLDVACASTMVVPLGCSRQVTRV